jgi:hypothetical protein
MGKLLQCKIDVTKINKELLFKGKKGTYLDFNVWINETPDEYGNDCSIEQKVKIGEDKNYIGNGRFYKPRPVQTETTPDVKKDDDDLPF